jgi:hypothetical protein
VQEGADGVGCSKRGLLHIQREVKPKGRFSRFTQHMPMAKNSAPRCALGLLTIKIEEHAVNLLERRSVRVGTVHVALDDLHAGGGDGCE